MVSAGAAVVVAERQPTLLVDLGGDIPAVLGTEADGPGLLDWLAAPAPPPDALPRLEVEVSPNLAILPLGRANGQTQRALDGSPEGQRWAEPAETLARMIALDHRTVLVDVGYRQASVVPALADRLLELATRSTLVTRPCLLAVRSANAHAAPDDVIVVGRQARTMRSGDVQKAIGAPVVAQLRWDAAIARAVDVGSVASKTPRSLRALAALSPDPTSLVPLSGSPLEQAA